MKKSTYFYLLFALMLTINTHARQVIVNSVATFKSAFNSAQDKDTISLKPGTYAMANGLRFPASGVIVVQSTNKDSMAVIQAQILASASDSTHHRSFIFRNLHIQGRYGDYMTNSAYIVDLNNQVFPIDTLAFRNCEISQNSRCIVRSGLDKGWTSGDLELLELTNCYLHHMNSAANQWSLFYLGHIPTVVNIKNNTFFNMPYCKSILSFRSMPKLSGRNTVINFINNTLAITYAQTTGVINSDSYLGEETTFNINNNAFLLPNWSNNLTMSKDSVTKYKVPAIVRCVFGMIYANNNLVDSMNYWRNGQILDSEGQGGFLVIDTVKTYRMRDLNVSWNDFVNPVAGDFSYLSTNPMANAGTNGGPIGDPRWIKTFTTPRILTVTANNVKAEVTPKRAYYENGALVTVKTSNIDGYTFVGWKKASDGTLLSTSNPYTFNISADMEIVAEYVVLQPRNVSVTISGSKSATYTITPKKDVYFEGDVITIAVNNHFINNFLGWSDGNQEMTRTITVAGDITLTANFTEYPFVLAWDFHQLTANNQTFTNLAANHFADAANTGIMNYVMLDTIRTVSTRNNKFTGVGQTQINCVARRTAVANFSNPDYLFIKFSTKGLTNLKVKSDIATDNSIFKVQRMQYALNGKNYTDFAVDTVKGEFSSIWRTFEGKLPVTAENQDSVWVRWIADTSTERLFIPGLTTSDYEYLYISKVIVIDNNFSANNSINANSGFKVYSYENNIIIDAENSASANVYNITGQKLRSATINSGTNQMKGFNRGVYIVQVNSKSFKVLVK